MNQQLITKDEVPPEVAAAPAVRDAVLSMDVVIANANLLVISTNNDYKIGSEAVQRIMGALKRLEEERLSLTRPLDAAKKRLMDWFAGPKDRLEQAQSGLRKKLLAFDAEQKRIADEARKQAEAEERARREAAEREAAQQRAIAQREAERAAREAKERQDAEDKARREAEAARKAGDTAAAAIADEQARKERMERIRAENQREREIEEANERAREAEAEANRQVALPATATPVKVVGQARRQVAKFEILDPNKISDAFWVVDEKAVAAMVRAKGLDAQRVIGDGIRVWMEDDLSFRAK